MASGPGRVMSPDARERNSERIDHPRPEPVAPGRHRTSIDPPWRPHMSGTSVRIVDREPLALRRPTRFIFMSGMPPVSLESTRPLPRAASDPLFSGRDMRGTLVRRGAITRTEPAHSPRRSPPFPARATCGFGVASPPPSGSASRRGRSLSRTRRGRSVTTTDRHDDDRRQSNSPSYLWIW